MPWKNMAKKLEYQRAYQRKWHAKKKEDPEYKAAKDGQRSGAKIRAKADGRYNVERQRRNDRAYRLREWEHEHRSDFERHLVSMGLGITAARRESNPIFTTIDKNGKKRTELLFEPFPTWADEPVVISEPPIEEHHD